MLLSLFTPYLYVRGRVKGWGNMMRRSTLNPSYINHFSSTCTFLLLPPFPSFSFVLTYFISLYACVVNTPATSSTLKSSLNHLNSAAHCIFIIPLFLVLSNTIHPSLLFSLFFFLLCYSFDLYNILLHIQAKLQHKVRLKPHLIFNRF